MTLDSVKQDIIDIYDRYKEGRSTAGDMQDAKMYYQELIKASAIQGGESQIASFDSCSKCKSAIMELVYSWAIK